MIFCLQYSYFLAYQQNFCYYFVLHLFSDCFLKLKNLEFALADYQQALEMKSADEIKNRISVVYNEMGIVSYYEKYEVYNIKQTKPFAL